MTTQKSLARRHATQARSKTTVQSILNSAALLIAEKGADVTMTEIAQRAGLVIGSLYQYFADKSAIHKAILIRHNADTRIMLHTYVSNVTRFDQFVKSVEDAFQHYFSLHQQDPLFNGIWSIVQTDAELQKIDVEDTLQNARYLQTVCGPMLLHVDKEQVTATCALVIQLAVSTARFARAVPSVLGQQMCDIFRKMIRDALLTLAATKSDKLAHGARTRARIRQRAS
jgi:AcrR family transcriptional regulator